MMGEDDFNKAGWKPRFQSEFSMGGHDFERYNNHLKEIEFWCGEVNACAIPSLEMCQKYFAGLARLYKLWRPIISVKTVKEQIDDKIEEARNQKRVWERSVKSGFPFSDVLVLKLVDLLDAIHTKLMEIKQVIGLGIVVKKNMSVSERINKGIRGNKNIGNLPEA